MGSAPADGSLTRNTFPRTVAVTVGAQELGTAAAGDVSTLPVPVSQPAPGGPAAQPHQLFSAFIGGPGGIALPSAPDVVPDDRVHVGHRRGGCRLDIPDGEAVGASVDDPWAQIDLGLADRG